MCAFECTMRSERYVALGPWHILLVSVLCDVYGADLLLAAVPAGYASADGHVHAAASTVSIV